MKIPFTKAHGTRNDFLLTWEADVPEDRPDGVRAETARALCDRHTGVGADGWMVVTPPAGAEAEGSLQLYNSDGGMAEMSGNGTRCAAAFLIRHGLAAGVVRVRTGAGIKTLRLLEKRELAFVFEMDMGQPEMVAERLFLPLDGGPLDVSLLAVGNPNARCRSRRSISTGARWARRSSRTRIFRGARTSLSCARWMSIPSMCASGNAVRARR